MTTIIALLLLANTTSQQTVQKYSKRTFQYTHTQICEHTQTHNREGIIKWRHVTHTHICTHLYTAVCISRPPCVVSLTKWLLLRSCHVEKTHYLRLEAVKLIPIDCTNGPLQVQSPSIFSTIRSTRMPKKKGANRLLQKYFECILWPVFD